jgi:RNA polymerase sigma-70 factor (ECF subfamily)
MATTSLTLLERLREPGDQKAWERFVDLYGPLLLVWAKRQGLQAADEADLAQEVFTIVLVKLPQFKRREAGSFRTWLRTIAQNKWVEWQRKRRPEPMNGRILPEVAVADPADEFWEKEYRVHLVKRALEIIKADFQPTTWQAAWQVLMCERSPGEVGAELGITVGAVHAARFRVITRLRQELAEFLDE